MSRRWGAMGRQVACAARMAVVLLVALGMFARPDIGWSACSSYVNDMTINEVYELANTAWVELRILDSAVDASVYNDWSIRVCANWNCSTYNLSSGVVMYPDTYPDWITIDVSKWRVDLRKNGGMDILLRDGDGNAIDYLSVNNYTRQEPDCSDFLYDTTIDTVSSDPKGIYRDPDGTGDWVELGLPGANGVPTEGYDNDDEVGRAELVAHYALDGDVTDSSDNGYDGTVEGMSDYQPAMVCDGVQLDGSGYLQVPDNDGFDLPESFTIMAWIHPDSLSVAGHSDLYSVLSKDTNYEVHVRSDGSLYWWWGDGSFETAAGVVPVGEWTHVAFVYSRQDGIMRILANGSQVASYAYADLLPTNSDAFLIGGDIATGGGELTDRRFYGGIDEVRIYNGTLSDGHIIYLMSTYNPCNLPTPLAEWRFDECGYEGASALAEDAQGSYDLSAQGTVGSEPDGVVGRAALLPGGEDAFLAATDVPLLDDWTVTTWFRMPFTDDDESRYHVLGAMAGGGTDLLWVNDRDDYSWGGWSNSRAAYGSFEFSTLGDGWHHLAAVAKDGRTDLYVDGVYRDSISVQPSGYLHYIGTSYEQEGGDEGFRAALDEYLVFSGALTETQIVTLYHLQAEGRNLDGTLRETVLCGPAIDHFEIVHDGSALTCRPEEVTVRACADADCNTLYTEDVAITLSPSGWIGTDTQTLTGGSDTFRLRHTTAEGVDLSVTGNPAAEQAQQCVNSGGGDPCTLTFYISGFLFELPDLEACQTSAEVAIQAVRMDDTTQACVGDDSFATTTRNLSFSASYVAPETGSKSVYLQGNVDATPEPLPEDRQVEFDDEAIGTFSFSYADAGSVTLAALFTGSGDEVGLVMQGSDTFVAYPHHLEVAASIPDDGTALDNATSSGTPHWPAGEDFDLTVSGVCEGGAVTPNFSWPTALSVQAYEPSTGRQGSFSPATLSADLYDAGVADTTASYSEVGTVTLLAVAEDYLDSGIDVTGTAAIGRFTPASFGLSWYQSPELAPACDAGGFTYIGDSFGYAVEPVVKLTAYNADGDVTENYTQPNWWKISEALLVSGRSYSAAEGTFTLSAGGASYAYPVDAAGSGTLTYDESSSMLFQRGDPVAPFFADIDLAVAVVDADGISASAPLTMEDIPFSGEDKANGVDTDAMRWGRLTLKNAYGSERAPLAMPLRAEYYDGNTFVTNTDDICTTLATSQLTMSGSVSSTAHLNSSLDDGDAGLVLDAPGATGYIDVEVDLLSLPWLRFDWAGNGTHDDDPTGRASFGIFEGSPAMIYLRESFSR